MEFLMILGLAVIFGLIMGLLHRYAPGTAEKIEQSMEQQREMERLRRLNKPTDAEMKADMQRFRTNWNQVADKDKRL